MAAWVVPAITAGASIISGLMQGDSASKAAGAQVGEQRRQFDAMRELLAPYVQVGVPALQQQQALIGLSGPEAQQQAISQLEAGPQFQSLVQQGENAMLQRASATGGLRGGNIQGALAQFRPALLSDLINQQYGRLGGLTALGQQSAAGVGATGVNVGSQIGAAQAGGILGQARGFGQVLNAIPQGFGMAYGMGWRPEFGSNAGVARQFGTLPGSQQTQMLAEQMKDF